MVVFALAHASTLDEASSKVVVEGLTKIEKRTSLCIIALAEPLGIETWPSDFDLCDEFPCGKRFGNSNLFGRD